MQSIPGLKLLSDKNAPSAEEPLPHSHLLQRGLESLASNCVIEPAGRARINTSNHLEAASIKNDVQVTSPRANLLSPSSLFGKSAHQGFRFSGNNELWEGESQDQRSRNMFGTLASFQNLAQLGGLAGPSPQNEQNLLKTLENIGAKKDTGLGISSPNGHQNGYDPSVRSMSAYLDDRAHRNQCGFSEPDLDEGLVQALGGTGKDFNKKGSVGSGPLTRDQLAAAKSQGFKSATDSKT